ncbi:hypothetical protein EUGRSUZ_L01384 [Eucalyptus grandis]|uniref:Uncharacterized protein n=1 Tax=Eucalyptus grandis TaxID=71139 RepID=A0A058ZVH4_EUCGR|nr:hypothetical protein EUGRSUZ_L01384 [Eucalyptus grandis]
MKLPQFLMCKTVMRCLCLSEHYPRLNCETHLFIFYYCQDESTHENVWKMVCGIQGTEVILLHLEHIKSIIVREIPYDVLKMTK